MMRISMLFPNGAAKALTFSYDDGVQQDARLMEIFDRYGMKATFNINSGLYTEEGTVFPTGTVHRRLTHAEALALYKPSDHEVAVHGLIHAHLDSIPAIAVQEEILADRKNLERDYGRPIRGMAYAYGRHTDAVVDALKHMGIVYARTTHSTKKFEMPKDWLRWEATCHHRDPELMLLADKFLGIPKDSIPRLFYVWGHAYEFEAENNWEVIERFCRHMSGKEDIWYATNLEIFEYTEAYERLSWAADLSCVKNPSAIDVTVTVKAHGVPRRTLTIPAGKTVMLEG